MSLMMTARSRCQPPVQVPALVGPNLGLEVLVPVPVPVCSWLVAQSSCLLTAWHRYTALREIRVDQVKPPSGNAKAGLMALVPDGLVEWSEVRLWPCAITLWLFPSLCRARDFNPRDWRTGAKTKCGCNERSLNGPFPFSTPTRNIKITVRTSERRAQTRSQ